MLMGGYLKCKEDVRGHERESIKDFWGSEERVSPSQSENQHSVLDNENI